MKLFINVLLLLGTQLLIQNALSGVGGIGGGTNAKAKYVIIQMCDGGESGMVCREVRLNAEYYDVNGNLKQSSASIEQPCLVYVGEGFSVPCKPDAAYGIPKFLLKLNEIFGEHGSQPVQPVDPNSY